MAKLTWGNGIKQVTNPDGTVSYATDLSLTGDTFYGNTKGTLPNGLGYTVQPNPTYQNKASLVFDSDPSGYFKDGSLFSLGSADIYDSGELPDGWEGWNGGDGGATSIPTVDATTAPIVKQYDAAIGKPLEPIKPDDESGIEYQNYLDQYTQYQNDLASYYTNSNQPDAINYRKDALAKQYGYAKNTDGSSIFSDGELIQLANGANTDNTAAQAKIDAWANNELAKYDTSNAMSGAKDIFLADLKSGKAAQSDYVAPFSKIKEQPEPEPTAPNIADGTAGGLLNQQTGTITKPDGAKAVGIGYSQDVQGQTAKDGITTAAEGSNTQASYQQVDTASLPTVSSAYTKAPTTIDATGTTVADPDAIKVVDLKDRVAHTDAATIDKTGTAVNVNDPRISSATNVNAIVDGTHAQNIAVAPDSLVSNRLMGLLGANNPYLQQARNSATVQSARRGLLNSGAAAGFAQDAAIKAALPIAQADAQTLYDAQKTNATSANTLLNTGIQLKSGAQTTDATNYTGIAKSNADENAKINTQNAQFIQDANFNNAGFNNTQSNSYENALHTAAIKDVSNKIETGTTNANNNLSRATDNAKLTINENQYAATLGLEANKFNALQLDEFKKLNVTIANAQSEFNASYARQVETAAALAKNSVWQDVIKNTYDSLKTDAGAANTLNNLFASGNITLASNLASHLWTMAESEDTAKKKEIENTLLHSFDMQKVTLTGNQAWDLAVLNNKSQVLTSKMGYDASLIKDLTTQSMASMAVVSTKDGMTDAGKTTTGNNINSTALAGASAFLNADYSSSSPIPSTASTAQQQQLAEIYNFLSSADSATVEKASKLVADAKATSKPKTT